MSDPTSIFGNPNEPATQPNNNPAPSNGANAPTDTNVAHLLSSIKNERGEQKYATLEAALEGLRNAQEFIPSLRQQTAEKDAEIERLRKEADRAAELERTLQALTSQPPQAPATPNAPALDESKLADLVYQTLSKREQEQLQRANLQTVVTTLQQSFGADAEKKFYDKATELGMSMEEINTLASKSPKAVLTMLGVTQAAPTKQNQPTPLPGKVNTAAFTPHQETFIGRNTKPVIVGATTADLRESTERAKRMVDELNSKGMSVYDLTDPKVYSKFFN